MSDRAATCVKWLTAVVAVGWPVVVGSQLLELSRTQDVSVDIPAQTLDSALLEFTRQTGFDFLYQSSVTAGRISNPIDGRLSVDAALNRLLADSGLSHELAAPDLIVITRSPRRPTPTADESSKAASASRTEKPPAPDTSQVDSGIPQLTPSIVVTARRRAELQLQYAGAAFTMDEGTLLAARADGWDDVTYRVPNAFYEERPGGDMNVFLRGAGTATAGSARRTDTGIGLYYDGAYSYLQGSRIPILFYDMARVETLSGPQGGLYGRNSVGGAIIAYTNSPQDSPEAFGNLEFGDYDASKLEGNVNIPLGDTVAVRLAGYRARRDSYYTNIDPDYRERGEETTSGRLRLAIAPRRNLELTLGYEYTKEDKGPQILVRQDFGQEHVSVSDTNGGLDRETNRLLAVLDWQPADEVTLKALTAYATIDSSSSSDVNNIRFDPTLNEYFVGVQAFTLDGHQFSQDLILSSASHRQLQWLVGASYFSDRQDGTSDITSGFPTPGLVTSSSTNNSGIDMWAGFADVSYELSPRLSLGASLRYSTEKRSGNSSDSVIIDPDTGMPFPGGGFPFEVDYDQLSPGASVTYSWSENLMGYVKVSTGYQSGGFNVRASAPQFATFSPSSATSVEGGAKALWFDGQLSTNLSYFHMRQSDYQIAQMNPPFNEFVNGAEVETNGVEAEIVAQPTHWLTTRLSYGYIDARFTEVDGSTRLGSVEGQRVVGIPRTTATVGMDVRLPVGTAGLSVFANVNYWLARDRADTANVLDDIDLCDLRIGLEQDRRYGLYVYANNLTDDIHTVTTSLADSSIISAPRVVGAGAYVKWSPPE